MDASALTFSNECRLIFFRELGRRRDTSGDRNSNLQKEFLLPLQESKYSLVSR